VLITGIEGLLEAAQLVLVEAAVGVAVKAVAQQLDDVGVVTKRPRRQALALPSEKRVQCLIDRRSGLVGHDRNVTDAPDTSAAIPRRGVANIGTELVPAKDAIEPGGGAVERSC